MISYSPVLEMQRICKSFPGVKALQNVEFRLRKGEIHALMGENGAGKSTLIKVLTGVEKADSGDIILDGKRISPKTPLDAQAVGISTVYQEVNLCPNLSVAENIFIGREPMKMGRIDWKTMNRRAEDGLKKLNVSIDVTKTLDNYSVAIQQMVAISRALDVSAKILILDEPTSSLDRNEVQKLFEVMNKLKREGLGIVFVTHFLDQVYEVSDRITVLRNGELVGEYETKDLPRLQLVARMIGKDFEDLSNFSKKDNNLNSNKQVTFISTKGFGRSGTINPFDMEIKKGEVLGLVGLLGSGRTETARLIFGVDKADSGQMYIYGEKVNLSSPQDAIKFGIACCPENRKTEGIIGDLSVRENIILALQAKKGVFKNISRKEQELLADKYIRLLNIKTAGHEQLIKNLSGGNQQKVILARWLATNPELLILDEPTRGIDIGTKMEIQKLILELAGKGLSVLFISSDLDEELRTCSRMAVYRDRCKVAEITGEDINEQYVMQTIAGG